MINSISFVLFISFIVAFGADSIAYCAPLSKELHQKALKEGKAGNNEKAASLLTRAIKLDPRNYKLYNDRGVIHRRLGKDLSALADYHEALRIHPNYTPALNNRGFLYLGLGKCEEALSDFNMGLKQKSLKLRLLYNRASAYQCLGKYEAAVKDMRRYVKTKPQDLDAIILLGDYLAKLGDKKEAIRYYKIAGGLTKDPKIAVKLESKVYNLERPPNNSRSPKKPGVHEPLDSLVQRDSSPVPAAKDAEKRGIRKVAKELDKVSESIFQQGKFFQKNRDWQKALVRFEDAYQLAKRHKKRFSQAWILMEIGKVHRAMGAYAIAQEKVKESIRLFDRIRQKSAKAVAQLELANIKQALVKGFSSKGILSDKKRSKKSVFISRAKKDQKYLQSNALASLGPMSVGTAPGKNSNTAANIERSDEAKELIEQLKSLRSKGDYGQLSEKLVELSKLYKESGLEEKALLGLNAAIGYKMKLNTNDGVAQLLVERAEMGKSTGQKVSALEDYVRAYVLAKQQGLTAKKTEILEKAKKLSGELTSQSELLINGLMDLWTGRIQNTQKKEAALLYNLGEVYQTANKNIAAGMYFERSAAVSLIESAKAKPKKTKSNKKFAQGLNILESLDYFKYLQVKRNLGMMKSGASL